MSETKAQWTDDRKRLLALAAFKYGEISEGLCTELTGLKREAIRDEMHRRLGKFKPLDEAIEAAEQEKRRRVYYQDIVYAVCNTLDRYFGGTTVAGTIEEPSTETQDRCEELRLRLSRLESQEPRQ